MKTCLKRREGEFYLAYIVDMLLITYFLLYVILLFIVIIIIVIIIVIIIIIIIILNFSWYRSMHRYAELHKKVIVNFHCRIIFTCVPSKF